MSHPPALGGLCPDCEAGRYCPVRRGEDPPGLYQTIPPTWPSTPSTSRPSPRTAGGFTYRRPHDP